MTSAVLLFAMTALGQSDQYPGKVLPVAQSPGKILPAPQAPGKHLPVPHAPSKMNTTSSATTSSDGIT